MSQHETPYDGSTGIWYEGNVQGHEQLGLTVTLPDGRQFMVDIREHDKGRMTATVLRFDEQGQNVPGIKNRS